MQINVSATGSSCALVGRFVFSTNGGYYYRFAPNPASSDLVVSATTLDQPGSSSATAAPPAEPFDAALYDGHGQLVKTKRGDQGKAVLDVRDLPNGLYYLRAGQGKNAVNEHIQLAH